MSSHDNNQSAPDIFTGYPGFVYDFNPATQTCRVVLAIENLFVGYAEAYTLQPNTELQQVPVHFLGAGGFSVTHPVPDKTPCYVHFAQRGIDHWVAEGKDKAGMTNGRPNPAFSQTFSHHSGVCFVGLRPMNQPITSFQTNGLEVRNADRSVRMAITNAGVYLVAGTSTLTITKSGAITVNGNTTLAITTKGAATIKAPTIMLDSDVTVSKSLTVNGGMSVKGGTAGSTFSITGDIVQTGSYTLNGIKVDGHVHTNPEGGNVGPMKAGA